MKISQFVPILEWLPSYPKSAIRGDLSAGITVGIMLIPQGMAYALVAGLPAIYGLYASTIPLVVYAIFGTSRQLSVGPVALISILTATAISVVAGSDPETYLSIALLLTLMVGAIQFFMGLSKLGFLIHFISYPIISGFTSAVAIIICISQLKHLIGIQLPQTQNTSAILEQLITHIGYFNLPASIIGIGGIIFLWSLQKMNKSIPSQIIVVVLAILVVKYFNLGDQGVMIAGEIPSGLPAFTIPTMDMAWIEKLFPMAVTIALIGFVSSIGIAKVILAKHRNYKIDVNQEFIGLGLSNIFGSFFQSFPVAGGLSRTAVNDEAGAKSGMASIIAALLIVLTLLTFTGLFYYLPHAILASIIIVSVSGLIDIKEAKFLWAANKLDFSLLIITFLSTLILGIEWGILIGFVMSILLMVYLTSRPHLAELGRIPGTSVYRNIKRFNDLDLNKEILIVRPDAHLYFANIQYIIDVIDKMAANRGEELELIVLDAGSINLIDSTALQAIIEMIGSYRKRNVTVCFSGVIGPVRDILIKGDVWGKIGDHNFFLTVQQAVDYYQNPERRRNAPEFSKYIRQTDVK